MRVNGTRISLTKEELNMLWRNEGDLVVPIVDEGGCPIDVVLTTSETRDTFRKGVK